MTLKKFVSTSTTELTRTFQVWLAIVALAASSVTMHAATIIWNAGSGVDTNWSDSANWVGGVAPGGGDSVKFFDTGANTALGIISNVVDSSFGGYIGTLQYGNTNGNHTTLIASGVTLNVTNGNLIVGTPGDAAAARNLTNAITGVGGTLFVSNTTAVISIAQGTATSVSGTRGNLDLSGLDTFVADVYSIGLGSTVFPNPASANQREAGQLLLAKTNNITLGLSDTLADYQAANHTNAIEMSRNPGNNAGILSFLYLGITNAIYADSFGFGRDKASASSAGVMAFNPTFISSTPTAHIRGTGGDSSRVTWWAIGDMDGNSSSSQVSVGTNDFTGGVVDAMVNVLSLARDCAPSHTASATIVGVLTFNSGTIDANTIYAGNQSLGPSSSTTGLRALINVGGANAVLKVNNNLVLGNTTQPSTAAQKTSGTLNITNGTVYANTVSVGATSVTNNINMFNGTLIITNTLATNASGLFTLNVSNSTLGLTVPGNASLRGLTKTLNTIGSANLIQLDPNPVIFPVYPTNISLIRYTTWTGSNTFALASVPTWAPNATIVSNGPNATVDLSLPTDPRPIDIQDPTDYSGAPGDNVTTNFSVVVANGSGTPLSYFWYYFTNGATSTNFLTDGFGPSGISTISNSATANMVLTNAQEADSGNYFVVVSNSYGMVTSAVSVLLISSTCIPPTITGPNNQTVLEGHNATFTVRVSADPVSYQQWQRNGIDILGANGSSLIVTNVQYPADDQAVFSLIATNACGEETNSAILSVTVPPVITNQPTSLVVTNTQSASFTVVAGGVEAPTYQWYKNNTGNPILNATNATFTIASASPSDMATYFVKVVNSAGSVTSSSATLTVNSTMAAVSLTPTNGASGICYDTPLTIVFSATPTLNNIGTIKIFNATNPATPVDTLNMSLGNPQGRTIAGLTLNSFPVIITGNTAVIYPHLDVLTSNQTYYVTIDDGVFKDSAGAFFAGETAGAWQFTTKVGGPIDPVNPVVAADGSADFQTVQGALDSLPTNAPSLRVIHINNGNYVEIVNVIKSNITFRGQSRLGTVVGYANNNTMNPATGIRMAFHVNAAFVSLENLTVVNTTPQGGSQAEALMIDSPANHFILNNAEVDSRQDTILANSGTTQGYFYNTFVQGNFDYIWGGGNLFITNCQFNTITGVATPNLTASRTQNGATGNWPGYLGLQVSNGFSFVECQLTLSGGQTNCSMADKNGATNGLSSFINCSIDTTGYTNADPTSQASQLLWEFGCSNLNNTVALNNTATPFLSFSQLTNNDPRLAAAINVTTWLNGWSPALAPNITSQPGNQTVNANQQATFTVAATGIPDPAYQWVMDGTNVLSDQTNATLIITNANGFDIGSYAAVVSNGAGSVTSSVVTLSVIPPASGPTLLTPSVQADGSVQFTISGVPGSAGFSYRLWASTNIALTPITNTWTLLTNDVFGLSPSIYNDQTTSGLTQRFYVITVP